MAKVYSMTGFGMATAPFGLQMGVVQAPMPVGEAASSTGRVSIELRSVNSRFLDITFKLPDELRPHEAALREAITAACKRGKIEVRGQVERLSELSTAINDSQLNTLLAAQAQVMAHDALAKRMSAGELLRWPGVLSTNDAGNTEADTQALRTALLAALEQALQAFGASRASEGNKLALFLTERCDAIDRYAEQAKALVPQAVERQQQRFIERWNEALKLAMQNMSNMPSDSDMQSINERAHERALSEAAAFALRIDVAEEIGRLLAHTSECRTLLAKGGELGKRLDFLIQELHREANTLGSKSASLEHTKVGIELKVLVEQMREQVQNIE